MITVAVDILRHVASRSARKSARLGIVAELGGKLMDAGEATERREVHRKEERDCFSARECLGRKLYIFGNPEDDYASGTNPNGAGHFIKFKISLNRTF